MQYCGCCGIEVEDFGEHEKTEEHKKNKEMMLANLEFDKDIKLKVVVKEEKKVKCPACKRDMEKAEHQKGVWICLHCGVNWVDVMEGKR